MTQREQYIKKWFEHTNELYAIAFDMARIGEEKEMLEIQNRIQAVKASVKYVAYKLYPDGKNKIILGND